jgi:hypothetical protein
VGIRGIAQLVAEDDVVVAIRVEGRASPGRRTFRGWQRWLGHRVTIRRRDVAKYSAARRTRRGSDMKYAVVYEQAPDNWAAYVPDLLGCVATGARALTSGTAFPQRIRSAPLADEGKQAANLPGHEVGIFILNIVASRSLDVPSVRPKRRVLVLQL